MSEEIYQKTFEDLKALCLTVTNWMEVNLDIENGLTECQGDEDCDHCHGLSILHDYSELIKKIRFEELSEYNEIVKNYIGEIDEETT